MDTNPLEDSQETKTKRSDFCRLLYNKITNGAQEAGRHAVKRNVKLSIIQANSGKCSRSCGMTVDFFLQNFKIYRKMVLKQYFSIFL